jgi:two-component system sensor histidine kinase/response regulator
MFRIAAHKEKLFDLVLLDMQMPEMDGFEATRAIREMEGDKKHIPVIAMTARAMKEDREKSLQAGMDDYISKPIEPEKMIDAIKKWTESSHRVKTPLQGDNSKRSTQPKDFTLDLKASLARFGDDRDFLEEMLQEFLGSLPKQLKILEEAIKIGDTGQ